MARIASTLEPASSSDKTRTLAIFAAVIAALYFGADIFVPIALAILLSFVLAPSVRFLQKHGLGRAFPVAFTVLMAVVVIGALLALIFAQIRDLSSDLPRYETVIVRKIEIVRGLSSSGGVQKLEEAMGRLASAFQKKPAETEGRNGNAPGPVASANAAAAQAPMPVQVVQPALGPIDTVLLVAEPLLHPLSTAFIVVIFVIFILLQREDLRNRAIRLFGASDLQRTTAAIDDGAKRLSRYLLTQCTVNIAAGAVVTLALWAIGVPSPILLGILFACMRFVPYIGPVVGSALPLLLSVVVDPGWTMMLSVAAALLVVEVVVGQVIEPVVYGHNTGMSPIAVILAATFWTVLWGPVGLLLSTPLTVCLVVLGRHVEHLAFLDVLFGDRPALSPSEIFYQRMLANDPIEAADHAQRCLGDMSLVQYLDDVALPALILALDDATQDRISLERQGQIRDAALEVVEDMVPDQAEGEQEPQGFWGFGQTKEGAREATSVDELVQEEPPAHLKAPGSVLCLGSRGPLDDAAATMLARVLTAYGIGARAESFARLSKTEINSLDVSSVRLICLSTLDGGSVAFLRFALRRLRRRAPDTPILLGTWWRREGLRETDADIDEAIKLPKAPTFIDAVRFCMAQRDGDQTARPDDSPGPALAAVS